MKRSFLFKTAPGPRLHKLMRLVRQLPYHLDLLIPCALLLGTAIVAAWLATGKAAELLDKRSGHPIEVQRVYLETAEYQEYSPTLTRLNPGVNFAVRTDGVLLLEIPDEELFPDLMMALHTLQSFRPGVAWEMAEFCVRTCPEKAVARVAVKGFKQELR